LETRPRGRILLVDDEALIRMGLRVMLQDQGYEVAGEAADGHEAVAKVASLAPDLVIMDIKMPGMDGLETTRRIMAAHPVPIIVLTAYNEQSLVAEAADAGVLAYLMKPVREADIGARDRSGPRAVRGPGVAQAAARRCDGAGRRAACRGSGAAALRAVPAVSRGGRGTAAPARQDVRPNGR